MDPLGEQLAGWGKVLRLQTRGRVSGHLVDVAVGFVEEPDGAVIVAAGSAGADWVRNLDADPRCRVTLGPRTFDALADRVEGPDAHRAVRDMILRYGTPAERLGTGPVFRLRPERGPDAPR